MLSNCDYAILTGLIVAVAFLLFPLRVRFYLSHPRCHLLLVDRLQSICLAHPSVRKGVCDDCIDVLEGGQLAASGASCSFGSVSNSTFMSSVTQHIPTSTAQMEVGRLATRSSHSDLVLEWSRLT